MFKTVNLVVFFKLSTLSATLYLSLLLGIKNSFIKGSKKFRTPCLLSNIELFALCLLTVYLMAKKKIF